MFGLIRRLRNRVEDALHPRPGFAVEINGKTHEGRALVVGKQRELTRSGAYSSITALQRAAQTGTEPPPDELVSHLDGMIEIAAAGLRRPRRWIERHVTTEELGRIVVATMQASNAAPQKGDAKGPPAQSPS